MRKDGEFPGEYSIFSLHNKEKTIKIIYSKVWQN
jgi:hypothetical protein